MADTTLSDPFKDFGVPRPTPVAPSITTPETLGDPFKDFGIARPAPVLPPVAQPKTNLTVEDVIADPERLAKIRKMMTDTKDIAYAEAEPEKVVEDFMSHMRWMNTNEVSTVAELQNLYTASDEEKAVYGEAYRIYDEMGSMWSNGDGWNAGLDYAGAVITSPTTWLGLGVGKIAGAAGTKAAAKAAVTSAINIAAKQAVKKGAGKATLQGVKTELKSYAAKGAAKWQIAGALAVEAPAAGLQDLAVQQTRMKTGVQSDYDLVQTAISTVAGSLGAIPAIGVLRRSANSTLGNTADLLAKSFSQRAKNAAKTAAPKVKASLEKAQVDWLKMTQGGKSFETDIPLQDAVRNWFFDVTDENSLVRILQESGADLSFESGEFTKGLIGYALNMGDEALADFNKAFEPLGLTFGESVAIANAAANGVIKTPSGLGDAVDVIAAHVSRAGNILSDPSVASRWFQQMKGVSVSKKTSQEALVNGLKEEVADVDLAEKEVAGYALSLWKKMLVSTYPTTALNVKGWAISRTSQGLADLTLAGGLLGRAGMKALINPSGAMKDLGKVKALAANQTFALTTLVDPFLSAEAFLALLEKAPSKIQKRISGQIYGGVDDFKPERFGLSSNSPTIMATEGISEFAQKISFVHLQDTLTKGVSGLTALDKESRLAFGKGITQLIKDGEAYKLTDEMWEKSMNTILRETFSEDLTKGKNLFSDIAKTIERFASNPYTGFLIPFGKFLNNTVAFTYRHSPLATVPVVIRALGGKVDEDVGETISRSVVGTAALYYMMKDQGEKQEEGLQWFEQSTENGSIRDISNVFPESLYALLGRITHNFVQGEGQDASLIESLTQQLGPLEALQDISDPGWLKDLTKFLTDVQTTPEDKNAFFDVIGDFGNFIAAPAGDILAGYTRPLDIYSRMIGNAYDETGRGMVVDRKQAEGVDRFVLGLTRYTNGLLNPLFGEENEYGATMMGAPKEAAVSPGPVRIPNPGNTLMGTTIQPPAKNLNKVLGMVDKPPFKVDSYTSGNPEYDAFVNQQVTPLLERSATKLLNNKVFLKAPQSKQIEMVEAMIREAKDTINLLLDGGKIGGREDRLLNERRKLLMKDRDKRRRAMVDLGIKTPENKLSFEEIRQIQNYMDWDD